MRCRIWIFGEKMIYPETELGELEEIVIGLKGEVYELTDPFKKFDIERGMLNFGMRDTAHYHEGDAIIMRSTMKRDKDLNEIWEYDVLEDRFGHKMVCVEDDGIASAGGLVLRDKEGALRLLCNWSNYKKLGNIYENKEFGGIFRFLYKL